MSEELKCPLCGTTCIVAYRDAMRCRDEQCDLFWLSPGFGNIPIRATQKLNARLAEAERSNSESIDPARLQIVETKVAQLKERGFRFAGYIMSDDIRRCTVDEWGRVEWWSDSQSHADAGRLQELRTEWATLRLKLSGDIEDVGQADMYGRGWCDAMAEALCRVRKLIDRTEAADETGENHES